MKFSAYFSSVTFMFMQLSETDCKRFFVSLFSIVLGTYQTQGKVKFYVLKKTNKKTTYKEIWYLLVNLVLPLCLLIKSFNTLMVFDSLIIIHIHVYSVTCKVGFYFLIWRYNVKFGLNHQLNININWKEMTSFELKL